MSSDEKLLRRYHEQLLGLIPPWAVSDFRLDTSKLRLDIYVEWPEQEMVHCPECEELCHIHDHRDERTWRHLDTMQFQTFLHCSVPRANCKSHGVQTIKIPWAGKGSRFTLLFERLAVDILLSCRNITKAIGFLRISWDQLRLIMEHAVGRGLSRREIEDFKYVGIDEKSFKKGHRYMSLITDITGSRVLDVVEGRNKEAADELWKLIPEKQRNSIQAVALDMWDPFIASTREHVPQADLVHDKFHCVGYLTEAVDLVRRQEHRELLKLGDETLSKTKYVWLKNPKNWTDQDELKFKDIKNENLKVSRAWAIKEAFSEFWNYKYVGAAKTFFKSWFHWATHSKLRPMIEAAKTLHRHVANILTYLKHRITNATAESYNSQIQMIKFSARGFRNPNSYRTAILFYCGRLNLYPQ